MYAGAALAKLPPGIKVFSPRLQFSASLRSLVAVTCLQRVAQFILSITSFLKQDLFLTNHAAEDLHGRLLSSPMKRPNSWSADRGNPSEETQQSASTTLDSADVSETDKALLVPISGGSNASSGRL